VNCSTTIVYLCHQILPNLDVLVDMVFYQIFDLIVYFAVNDSTLHIKCSSNTHIHIVYFCRSSNLFFLHRMDIRIFILSLFLATSVSMTPWRFFHQHQRPRKVSQIETDNRSDTYCSNDKNKLYGYEC